MSTVIIREFDDSKNRRGMPNQTDLQLDLVTDAAGLPIQTVTTTPGVPVDSAQLTASTNVVEIESPVNVRVALRPKGLPTTLPATPLHCLVPANTPTRFQVTPSGFLNFLE